MFVLWALVSFGYFGGWAQWEATTALTFHAMTRSQGQSEVDSTVDRRAEHCCRCGRAKSMGFEQQTFFSSSIIPGFHYVTTYSWFWLYLSPLFVIPSLLFAVSRFAEYTHVMISSACSMLICCRWKDGELYLGWIFSMVSSWFVSKLCSFHFHSHFIQTSHDWEYISAQTTFIVSLLKRIEYYLLCRCCSIKLLHLRQIDIRNPSFEGLWFSSRGKTRSPISSPAVRLFVEMLSKKRSQSLDLYCPSSRTSNITDLWDFRNATKLQPFGDGFFQAICGDYLVIWWMDCFHARWIVRGAWASMLYGVMLVLLSLTTMCCLAILLGVTLNTGQNSWKVFFVNGS